MGRALVLNASYEALGVVTARRALILVLGAKASLVSSTGIVVRSERLVTEIPSVVRLRYFVKVPYQRRCALSRRGVFARDGHRCQYCGGAAESIDHVQPRSRGGTHSWDNVVAACRRCNTAKRDRLLTETTMRLRSVPHEPTGRNWLRYSMVQVPAQWEPYLETAGHVMQSA